jgi:hypothetical protein
MFNGPTKNSNRTIRMATPGVAENYRLILWSCILTVAIEILTCLLRFGFRLESTRSTASSIGRLTAGIRIHHGYIGLFVILIACWQWDRRPKIGFWLLATGLALVFSDLIHHFVVLWIVVGDPQFDLVYP